MLSCHSYTFSPHPVDLLLKQYPINTPYQRIPSACHTLLTHPIFSLIHLSLPIISQVLKEADVVRAIEQKHQLPLSDPPTPTKQTSSQENNSRDRNSSLDILGIERSDTVRQGQGQGHAQGQGQGQRKWENNMTTHMTTNRSGDRDIDEVTRVTESAQMVAAKVKT